MKNNINKHRNKFTYDNVHDIVVEEIIEDNLEKKKISAGKRKQNYRGMLHQYNYAEFNSDNTYNLNSFLEVDKSKKNTNKISNYETLAFSLTHLVYCKLFAQALGYQHAIMIAEYSRLSMSFPINKYGFFSVSYKFIQDDIGLSEKQQRRISEDLEKLGFITTITFRKQKRKFYRFNDKCVHDYLMDLHKNTYRRITVKNILKG